MECVDAVLALAALAVLPLAVAAYRQARAGSVRLAALETETARLRQQLESLREPARAAAEAGAETAVTAATAVMIAPAAPLLRASLPGETPPAAVHSVTSPGGALEPGAGGSTWPVAAAVSSQPGRAAHGGFEELVGGRLLPWIAAMALAFAGAYLVKYSFERGWISPPVRVAMGVAFGIGLLALSTALRRSSGRISEALAAAGVADLFACFLSAVHVYHLVGPAAGFGLMALTTAVAVALSLRQGIMVALLGLVGGFLTPALVQTAQPSARNLFGYLLLLVAGLLAVARRRGWPWLGFAALGAALLWAGAWLAAPFHGGDAAWLSLFLLLLAAAAALAATAPAAKTAAMAGGHSPGGAEGAPADPGTAGARRDGTGDRAAVLLAVTAALALLAGTVARSGYALDEWGFLGLLAAGILTLAWLEPRYLPLAWIAAALLALLLAIWGFDPARAGTGRFLAVVAAGGGLFASAGWGAALWGPRRRPGRAAVEPRSGAWAALAAAAGVTFFLVAWSAAHRTTGSPAVWGAAALALAALYLAAAVPAAHGRRRRPDLEAAVAALAVAVTTLVSLAVPIALGRDSLAVAWALEAAALVWLAERLEVPALDTLARLLAVAAVLGALFSQAPLRAAGELPLLNELLYAYGVPLAALAAAAWLAGRREVAVAARRGIAEEMAPPRQAGAPEAAGRTATPLDRLARELPWEALLLLFALVTLEVDQLFQPGAGPRADLGLSAWAAVTASWLLLGWGLLRATRAMTERAPGTSPPAAGIGGSARPKPVELAGRLIILAGLGAAMLGAGLAVNPLWSHQAVGSSPLLNALLFAYALPACLGLLGAGEVSRRGGRRLPPVARFVALVLGFAWVSLEVRQLFHGTFLELGAGGPPGAGERYAYSAAWVLYGVALLIAGIARRGAVLRYGSLGVMLLAVLKVFLYDTARLSDLYRVLSFLGLGASLLLLAFLYQRFVLRPERP
jgi:uncharacterized membrane protein